MYLYDRIENLVSDGDTDHDLYLLFSHARYLTFRAREKELQRYRLSPEQAQILGAVQAMKGTATPAKLSRVLLRQPHSISAIIERMEKKGLLKKVKDLERKNLVRVVLTQQGEKAYEITTKRGPIHRILGSLNENEREQFQKCLEIIAVKACSELGIDRDNLLIAEPPSTSEYLLNN